MSFASIFVPDTRWCVCALLASTIVEGGAARAANFAWNNASGGNWETASNWTLTSGTGTPPPDVGDSAEFNLANTYSANFVQVTGSDTWALDRILATHGVVTIEGRAGGVFGTSSFLNLLTGAADIEVNGGHLILHDTAGISGGLFTVNIGDDLIVRNGLLDIDGQVAVNTADLVLGASGLGESGEVRILGGASLVDTSAVLNNRFGFNGASGTLTIDFGTVTLAGDTLLGVSGTSGSTGVITVNSLGDLFFDDLAMGGTLAGAAGTLTVSGAGFAQQSGASTLVVGGSAGAGVINVSGTATLDSGTGNITINATGDVNISGGTFQADGFLDFQGGQLDLSGGELILNNGMDAITSGGVFNFTGGTVRVENGLARLETSLNYGGPSLAEIALLEVSGGNTGEVQFAVRIGNSAGTFGRAVVTGTNGGVRSTLHGYGGGAGADLIVGGAGYGELEVTDGAFASFRDDFFIGEQAGSQGSALVRGESEGFRSKVEVTLGGTGAAVSVGQAGVGTLDIENGGHVQTSGDVFLASLATGNAVVTLGKGSSCGGIFLPPCSSSDATLQSGDDVWVGGGSSVAGGTAVLNVNDGGLLIAPNRMRLYAAGTVNLDGGRIELGTLEVQGGTLNFTDGELHFTGSATFDANLVSAIGGVSSSHDAGLITVTDTLSITAPFTQQAGDLTTDTLNLSAVYTLDGGSTGSIGELSLRLGSGLDTYLNFVSGFLRLNDTSLLVGTGGLLGPALSFETNKSVINNGSTIVSGTGSLTMDGGFFQANDATTVQASGNLQVISGTYDANSSLTIQTGGNLQVLGGTVNHDGLLHVENGGSVTNQGTLNSFSGINVDAGGSLTNTGNIHLSVGGTIAGDVDNQGTIRVIPTAALVFPAVLTLSGGGEVTSSANASIDGTGTGVINNVDNQFRNIFGSNELTLSKVTLINGPTAQIGDRVILSDVSMTGGWITGAGVEAVGGVKSVFNGLVQVSGDLTAKRLEIAGGSELRVESGGLLQVGGGGGPNSPLELSGLLRAEVGGTISLDARTHDFTAGTLSLADDVLHSVAAGAVVQLAGPLTFDNLAVGDNPNGFVPNVFGANPVVGSGQGLTVLNTATLNEELQIDGGTFTTGFLNNYQNLDLHSGEFHLTLDDFIVGPGAAGPVFGVGVGVTLSVDEAIEISTGNRLTIAGGTVNVAGGSGTGLTNNGDLDVIEGAATFAGLATNPGDINAIDSVLTFTNGLTNSGQLNLINTTVNGAVAQIGSAALSGVVTFAGDVSGGGGYSGGGTAVFQAALSPDDSPAVLSFAGNVDLAASSTFFVEVGGVLIGDYDRLSVAGDLSLAGDLTVDVVGGFQLGPNQQFLIGDVVGFLSGQFIGLGEGALVGSFGGRDLFITYAAGTGNDVALFTTGLPGDFDFDGDVDGRDFLVWQRNPSVGDLADWQANYGAGSLSALHLPPSTLNIAVPEPGALAILIGCLAVSSMPRRHKR